MKQHPFVLSIEPTGEKSFLPGLHLGTDERLAMRIAEERFHGRNAAGMPTCTVALIRNRRLWAVYDGEWSYVGRARPISAADIAARQASYPAPRK